MKKIGITRKFITSWKPCMSSSSEPMAVPSAQNTTAISIMNTNAIGTRQQAVRPEPGNRADDQHQRALQHRDGGAAERPPDHDLDARHRRDQRLLQEAELPIEQQPDAGEDRHEEDRHADDARARGTGGSCRCRPAGRSGRGRTRARAGRASAGRATPPSARAIACSASAPAARGCTPHSSLNASTSSRTAASDRRWPPSRPGSTCP